MSSSLWVGPPRVATGLRTCAAAMTSQPIQPIIPEDDVCSHRPLDARRVPTLSCNQADLLGMLQVESVALGQTSIHCHFHPHHLVHQSDRGCGKGGWLKGKQDLRSHCSPAKGFASRLAGGDRLNSSRGTTAQPPPV